MAHRMSGPVLLATRAGNCDLRHSFWQPSAYDDAVFPGTQRFREPSVYDDAVFTTTQCFGNPVFWQQDVAHETVLLTRQCCLRDSASRNLVSATWRLGKHSATLSTA